MERDDLIRQLIAWHDNDEHQKVIDAIEKIPRSEWDFIFSGLYARALNNLDRYKEALAQLFMFEEEGREDGIWNFRVGYSLYYLNREAEAVEYFQRAIDFGDDGDDTWELLKRSIFEATVKALLMDGVKLLEAGEKNTETIEKKFDEIMTGINACRDKHFPNDPEIKETVKDMVHARIMAIIGHFNLNMSHEILMRNLD